ncbi:MATE family efflux transporter [Cryomorpha ignava]|uniref:Multidrug-efflux transporter n=1 Tax=Cryomorpha ignava TaxID=101383 RepID=A0A7K3WVL4_9FLAO|nr:MATE family efflux transporter [Cryomorpha ignava]NEN24645.1 MATE family efflux transporter [Cryomorpha ignava]
MTVREHYKTNMRIALPVMIGQLGHTMVSVADSIMVGQLGTIELAAVALGNSLFAIFMVFGIGITSGITPLVAKADGMKSKHLQGVLLRHGFWVNLVASIVLFAIISFLTPVLYLLDQDPGVVPLAQPYLIILSGSIIPLMMFMTFKQFAEGLSDTKVAMVVIVGCNLVNVGLNYVFIFGKLGFEPMGLIGAGWATLIARILMFIVMWIYVRRANRFKMYNLRIRVTRFRKTVTMRLLQVGIPSGLQYIFEVSAFSLAAIFAGMISATALAAHQIAINIASVSYMAVTGLGAAATVRIGNQAGQRDFLNLKLAASTIFKMGIAWMALTGLIILIFKNQLAGFYSTDPDVLALAGKMLIVVVIFQLSDGIQAVGLGALRGFTDVKIPTYITFAAYWLFTLPLAFYLSQYTVLGAMGIWYALAAGLTVSAILLVSRFKRLLADFVH